MGVCCIVLDIDRMLFEFCMNFLNIEKKKNCRFLFSIFHVFFAFYTISNIKKKIVDRDSGNLYLLVKWNVVSPDSRSEQWEYISKIQGVHSRVSI